MNHIYQSYHWVIRHLQPAAYLPPEALEIILRALLPGFLTVFALGIVLLLAAAIGKTIIRRRTGQSAQLKPEN